MLFQLYVDDFIDSWHEIVYYLLSVIENNSHTVLNTFLNADDQVIN